MGPLYSISFKSYLFVVLNLIVVLLSGLYLRKLQSKMSKKFLSRKDSYLIGADCSDYTSEQDYFIKTGFMISFFATIIWSLLFYDNKFSFEDIKAFWGLIFLAFTIGLFLEYMIIKFYYLIFKKKFILFQIAYCLTFVLPGIYLGVMFRDGGSSGEGILIGNLIVNQLISVGIYKVLLVGEDSWIFSIEKRVNTQDRKSSSVNIALLSPLYYFSFLVPVDYVRWYIKSKKIIEHQNGR